MEFKGLLRSYCDAKSDDSSRFGAQFSGALVSQCIVRLPETRVFKESVFFFM